MAWYDRRRAPRVVGALTFVLGMAVTLRLYASSPCNIDCYYDGEWNPIYVVPALFMGAAVSAIAAVVAARLAYAFASYLRQERRRRTLAEFRDR